MSTCDPDGCEVTQGSLQQYNITVVAANKSVICIGSNHVSTSNVSASTDRCEPRKWHRARDSGSDTRISLKTPVVSCLLDLQTSQPQIPEPSISWEIKLVLGVALSILVLVIVTVIFIVLKVSTITKASQLRELTIGPQDHLRHVPH